MVKGFSFSVVAHMNNAAGFVVQHNGQVFVPLFNRYFIDGQDSKSIIVDLTILGFQILFVDFLDPFSIQLKMPGHFGDRHYFAELMDISCKSPGNPQIRMKKIQHVGTHISVTHVNISQTSFVGQPGNIVSIFKKDSWLGIGICNAVARGSKGAIDDLMG